MRNLLPDHHRRRRRAGADRAAARRDAASRSTCRCRCCASVSPIHIEYLQNMGVGASMSISIIVDGQAVGPVRLPPLQRRAARASSGARSPNCSRRCSRCGSRAASASRWSNTSARARDISDQLLGAVASDETLLNDPDWLGDILTNAIPARRRRRLDQRQLRLLRHDPGRPAGSRRSSTALNAHGRRPGLRDRPDRRPRPRRRGLLPTPPPACSPSRSAAAPRDYVVLFRQEMIRSVRWARRSAQAGRIWPQRPAPDAARELRGMEGDGAWPLRARSRRSELRVAETLRATLIEVVLRLADEASAERQAANERQELLIAELNHRVRNILGADPRPDPPVASRARRADRGFRRS